ASAISSGSRSVVLSRPGGSLTARSIHSGGTQALPQRLKQQFPALVGLVGTRRDHMYGVQQLIVGQPALPFAAGKESTDKPLVLGEYFTVTKVSSDHVRQLANPRRRHLQTQAATQERGRKLPLAVAGDDNDWKRPAAN